MSARTQLNGAQRDFLRLVHRAVLSNPFSPERMHADVAISGAPFTEDEETRLAATVAAVRREMARLETAGRIDLHRYGQGDRELLTNAILFDFFHRFAEPFDRLIEAQQQAGDEPLRVEFAPKAISYLTARGVTPAAARRYLALCFQLRRAYYFIKSGLIGRSAGMVQLRRSLWNNVFTANLNLYDQYLWNRMEDFSTLILGETGTGKGTVANAIGRSGFIPFNAKKQQFAESFTASFVALNLSQYPEALIESELFGHRKGAFTGAVDHHKGVFSRCSPHGAIFLDEIGEVAAPQQIKLLKVLEERVFHPVGSHRQERFGGRIIAATNRTLAEIENGKVLRRDFFFRLCSDLVMVPPLRQRLREDPGELDEMLAHTVFRLLGRPSPELAEMCRVAIVKALGKDYRWPGNVRELAQCARRILLTGSARATRFTGDHPPAGRLARAVEGGKLDANGLLTAYCHHLYRRWGTYGEVARITRLDRRTVKKYVLQWQENQPAPEDRQDPG